MSPVVPEQRWICPIPGAELYYDPHFLQTEEATQLFRTKGQGREEKIGVRMRAEVSSLFPPVE